MKILLDTNIIILRENNHVIPDNLTKLMSLLNGLEQCSLHVHYLSKMEIQHDLNLERRSINFAKISSYAVLNDYPDCQQDSEYLNQLDPPKSENDIVDNQLLYCVYRNVVDYLITEDHGLLKKAEKLGIKTVININEAIVIFDQFFPKTDLNLTQNFVKKKAFALNVKDSFFDSLKNEYKEFEHWWQKIANRECYAYLNEKDELNALLIPKIENKKDLDFNFRTESDKILKICLFKVSSRAQGLKLGERLLKIAFDYAAVNLINDIYLTHFCSDNDYLVSLIENYGFYKYAENSRGESIFLKHVTKPAKDKTKDISELNKKYYPSFCSNNNVRKHIIPIQPYFHDLLFPDYQYDEEHQSNLLLENTPSEGNSIKKAYICNAKTTKIQPNDILLFYRTRDYKCITTLGIVDEVYYKKKDPNEIYKLISKRTVFDLKNIENLCKKDVLVILFKQQFYLRNHYPYEQLLASGSIHGPIQTIMEISDANYKQIIQGNIDARFIID